MHWCNLHGHTCEFSCFWRESWDILEKHAIAELSGSTSLVTEKSVGKKKKKTPPKCVYTCLFSHHWSPTPCTILGTIVSLICGIQDSQDVWVHFLLVSWVQLFATPRTAACQASLSNTNSRGFLKIMSIELVTQSNHLILCQPLLLTSVFPSIRVFSNESLLCITWPKYSSVSCSMGLSNEY